MKKISLVAVMIVLVLALVLISIPQSVQAGLVSSTQAIAAGNWNTGTVTEVDLSTAPAPEWLQLMTTDAVVVKEPTKICHELGGGKYHWVGEIRKLVDDKWVKLETITKWSLDEEGTLMSCANAPTAGTYALFAYYNGPQEYFPIIPVPTDEPTVTPTLVPSLVPTGTPTETPTITPTIAPTGTPVSCGIHKIIVEGSCVCEPGYTLNKGICTQKQQ